MIGAKFTLAAATATKIVDSTKGVGSRDVILKSALTDLALGGPTVTVATGYPITATLTHLAVKCGTDDLWAISTGGGDIFVLYPENC